MPIDPLKHSSFFFRHKWRVSPPFTTIERMREHSQLNPED